MKPKTKKKAVSAGRDTARATFDPSMDAVYRRMRENINLLMAKYDLNPCDVAEAVGMYKRTFSSRRKSPWTFTFGEVELVAKVLRVDAATLMFGEVVPVDMSGLSVHM